MGKRLTKREREKIKQRQATKSLKKARMIRGDERRKEYQASIPDEPVPKPISEARARRLALDNLTESQLPNLVQDKCLYSNIYFKMGVNASETIFDKANLYLDVGVTLTFPEENSGREHNFGFELTDSFERGRLVRIHYQPTHEGREYSCLQTKEINPKKISARCLVDMIGQYK